MGWNFDQVGMQVVFARSIPGIVRDKVRGNVDEFLRSFGLTFSDIQHIVAHPGGVKVIEAYEQALNLAPGRMAGAREVLRDYGNMSSPTVLFVLSRLFANSAPKPGDHALVTALGPGFSAENILLRF
jgi:alkylresorcinol/alkylpyrone synthase